jgi:ppGpp synthetase/RelA/SpoT-type nucleotidyltranferase
MNIVDDYLKTYNLQFDFYQKISQICAQQCENGLESLGVKSIVTYRAKRHERLRDKLRKRIEEGTRYPTIEDINKDILDLAGVRIALYFPGDQKEVGRYIESHFDLVRKPKIFPAESKVYKKKREKKFPGRKISITACPIRRFRRYPLRPQRHHLLIF